MRSIDPSTATWCKSTHSNSDGGQCNGRPHAKVRDRVGEMSNTALIMDWLGTLVELLLRPRGLEVD
ncbi:hypothetical protein [Streptomyces sioyaensis]|uniref:hypothetical protein n=1 Tax=Streptomyces sioyaensis TaxID=67364 RepID=UPI0037A13A41